LGDYQRPHFAVTSGTVHRIGSNGVIWYSVETRNLSPCFYVEGIISLRGKIIPVIDLAMRLALTTSKIVDKRALIVETAGREIGIVVDEVTEVIHLQDGSIEPPPTETANGYIRGIGKEENRLLILLNVDKLFGEGEIEELKKVG
jgi:purine-binding chemotaxis protein CheW